MTLNNKDTIRIVVNLRDREIPKSQLSPDGR